MLFTVNYSIESADDTVLNIGVILKWLWGVMSSPIAVGIYVILVLAAVVTLIGFLLA